MTSRLSIRDLPIGRKLLLLWLAAMGAVLISLSTVSIVQEVANWRDRTVHELTSNARILAANTAPALLFGDRVAANETLAALSAAPNIVFAGVYDASGTRFALHGAADAGPLRRLPGEDRAEHRFQRDALVVSEPIVFRGERVGSIYLKSDLRELYAEVLRSGLVTLLIATVVYGLTGVLLQRLQRGIVAPIVQLSGLMSAVTTGGTYAVRAPDGGGDEVGVLARAYNLMLQGIQERDTRLDRSNTHLQQELVKRTAAQEALRTHDAMLKAVAHGAAELLGSLDLDDAIASVLELIGLTLAVSRVQLGPIETDRDGHLRYSARHEWRAPGLTAMVDDPIFERLDLVATMPDLAAAALLGERTSLAIPDARGPGRDVFERTGVTSVLFTPVMTDGKLWGGLWFMDAAAAPRAWNWAETDTLGTLAVLIGVSTTRSRSVRDLAEANTIVQNSPTVLYRLKGAPDMPLTYVSRNVTRLGYDPAGLIAANTSFQTIVANLIHPDDRARLRETMADLIDRKGVAGSMPMRMLSPSGEFRWFDNIYNPVRDGLGRLMEIDGSITDITARKQAEDKIALLARADGLTGLANRTTFVERLHQAFAATRRGASPFAVLYLDLDHFKDVNDTRGHPVGDLMLQEAATRLKSRIRDTDMVARMGGDEFAVLQMETSDPADAGVLATAIIAALDAPFIIEGDEMHVTASVGISPFTADVAGPDAMLAQADVALYRAKDEGRDQFRFHTVELDKAVSERVTISEDLRKAIDRDELELHYQPQVELTSGLIVGMEALVRWHHPSRGLLRPADFMPIAESTGVIRELGRWVLEHACKQMKLWREQGMAPQTVTVNVSMLQLKGGEAFVKDVADTLARAGVQPAELELDITESMMARAQFTGNDVVRRLQALGVQIAIDDFGADYSSFDYVRTYKVNHLKIARQFIKNATQDRAQAATVRAIIGVGHDLGIPVIAEGVETSEQRTLLMTYAAGAIGQGFYFSKPLDAGAATILLQQRFIAPGKAA